MASTDATPLPLKNTAFRVTFPILDNTGQPVSGAAGLDSEVSKDQGTFADCTNEATEIATASGIYYLDLTSTEMNADTVSVQVKTSTTDAKTSVLVIYPSSAGKVQIDLQTIKTQTVTAAAGITVLASVGTAVTSTAQTGDTFTRLGAPAGASTAADIAAVNAKTTNLPAAPASTTNITAGMVTTVTNLTNAPTAGDFTAAMKTSLNAATPNVTVSDKTGFSLAAGSIATATFAAGATIPHVTLADTVTAYTGNTPQTGDAFARIGVNGAGLTVLATAAALAAVQTHGDSAWATATGFSTLTQASIRMAIGIASANLDTQLLALIKIQAASYDSASVSGTVITLSNGKTQTVTDSGRVTSA